MSCRFPRAAKLVLCDLQAGSSGRQTGVTNGDSDIPQAGAGGCNREPALARAAEPGEGPPRPCLTAARARPPSQAHSGSPKPSGLTLSKCSFDLGRGAQRPRSQVIPSQSSKEKRCKSTAKTVSCPFHYSLPELWFPYVGLREVGSFIPSTISHTWSPWSKTEVRLYHSVLQGLCSASPLASKIPRARDCVHELESLHLTLVLAQIPFSRLLMTTQWPMYTWKWKAMSEFSPMLML
nr:uncharacterized protein LOC120362694 [Saimiri boliviensis boliviensis]